jgi:hypothetical protein
VVVSGDGRWLALGLGAALAAGGVLRRGSGLKSLVPARSQRPYAYLQYEIQPKLWIHKAVSRYIERFLFDHLDSIEDLDPKVTPDQISAYTEGGKAVLVVRGHSDDEPELIRGIETFFDNMVEKGGIGWELEPLSVMVYEDGCLPRKLGDPGVRSGSRLRGVVPPSRYLFVGYDCADIDVVTKRTDTEAVRAFRSWGQKNSPSKSLLMRLPQADGPAAKLASYADGEFYLSTGSRGSALVSIVKKPIPKSIWLSVSGEEGNNIHLAALEISAPLLATLRAARDVLAFAQGKTGDSHPALELAMRFPFFPSPYIPEDLVPEDALRNALEDEILSKEIVDYGQLSDWDSRYRDMSALAGSTKELPHWSDLWISTFGFNIRFRMNDEDQTVETAIVPWSLFGWPDVSPSPSKRSKRR